MANPFFVDAPSPPLPASPSHIPSPRSHNSTEAFPDFPSSPFIKSSPASQHRPDQPHLEIPGQQSQRPNRATRGLSQRLPPTALLGNNRSPSHNDLSTPTTDRDEQPQQRLPRPLAAPSLTGPSIRPNSMIAPDLMRGSTVSISRHQPNAEELKSESLWADMQRTLADVELSAMKSSHLFNAPHSHALEKLRATQLALAQAWARSEADETGGQESEDEYLDSEAEVGTQAGQIGSRNADAQNSSKGAKGKTGKEIGQKPVTGHTRQRSSVSSVGRDLEEETERDIRMARKRREANDHYFSQVNRGVLDVVARLDEVASAMRIVEKESRAVWEEMGRGESTTASGTEPDGDTDTNDQAGEALMRHMTKATTTTNTTGTGSGTEMSDSPSTPKKGWKLGRRTSTKETKKSPKENGR